MKKNIALIGFLHALAATAYIALVVFVINHASAWFGKTDTPWTGMAALMLFVLSAGVMASLAFVRPALWYMDGKKNDALQLLSWMIVFFFIMTVMAFAGIALFR